jgi:hypothetical protein
MEIYPVKAIRILAYSHEAPGRAFSILPCNGIAGDPARSHALRWCGDWGFRRIQYPSAVQDQPQDQKTVISCIFGRTEATFEIFSVTIS